MIGIIIAAPIDMSPFANKYISILEQKSIPYEIIEWDRSGKKSSGSSKIYTFSEHTQRYVALASKAMPFLHFRKFVKKIVKQRKYDKLVILTTQTAVILFDLLLSKKYKNKYFFDYRDTSYEYIGLYKRFINKLILNSSETCISSYGFKKYLTDKKDLIIAHNFQDKYYDSRTLKCSGHESDKPIIMGYVGYLREYEYLIKFVDAFGSDKRFEFHIHGSGDCVNRLTDYAKKYDNVKIFGAYKEEDKMNIVDSFDMICYNYPYSFVNYPAVANKFYDGLIRKKPMFANLDTFSGELIKNYGLGISLKENESDISEKLYNYYMNFNRQEFEKNCEDFLLKVKNEDKIYVEKINEFLNGKEI